jgi:hypothetical protein
MCPQQKESVCFSTNLQVIVALLSGHQTSTCLWIHVNLSSWGLGPNQNEWVSPKWDPISGCLLYIYIYPENTIKDSMPTSTPMLPPMGFVPHCNFLPLWILRQAGIEGWKIQAIPASSSSFSIIHFPFVLL